MSRLGRVLCLAVLACLVGAAPAFAKVHHVHHPGQSIQAALDAASPGDTVLVHRGTYHEALQIDKDGIRLRGQHVLLRPPASPANTVCNTFEPVTGICVVGNFNPDTGDVIDYLTGAKVTGFTVEGFSGVGVFAVATERLTVSHDKLLGNGGYGVFSLDSKGPRYLHDLARGNGAPGLYVGDSPQANAIMRHNRSIDNNGEGILLRNAIGGRVSHNRLEGNCAGLFALADAPGPAGNFNIDHNRVAGNNKACPGEPDEDEPPISGAGIALIGAFGTRVHQNWVLANRPSGASFVSGGIAVVKGPGGTEPQNDSVAHNKAFGNQPADLLWDQTGTAVFKKNKCGTSDPAGLCTGRGGKAHPKHVAHHRG
jgi:nitrous oxidase accessory protein NosD